MQHSAAIFVGFYCSIYFCCGCHRFSVFSESELMGSHGCLGAHAAQTLYLKVKTWLKKHQHGDVVFEFSEISQLKLFKTLEWLKADNHHL